MYVKFWNWDFFSLIYIYFHP